MKTLKFIEFPVWRILPLDLVVTPATPARAPEGRFHHSGQVAAYAFLSAEGASVAIQSYLNDNISRKLIPMQLKADCVTDERCNTDATVIWQDIRASGQQSPTWTISDAARDVGAQAMLYSSRSRPDLSHIVVLIPPVLASSALSLHLDRKHQFASGTLGSKPPLTAFYIHAPILAKPQPLSFITSI